MTTESADPLAEVRGIVERMTPGEWSAVMLPHDSGEPPAWHLRTMYHDAAGRRHTAFPAHVQCGAQDDETNAAGIVAAVRLLRALADPGAEEALEAKLDEIRDAIMDSGDHTTIGRRFARAILARLAKIAMGGGDGNGR